MTVEQRGNTSHLLPGYGVSLKKSIALADCSRRCYQSRPYGSSAWKLSRIIVLMACLVSQYPLGIAKAGYRIDGIAAPQVRPNPLADQLQAQLQELQLQLNARSRTTSLDEALEAGLLHNPLLAAAYAEIQGQQWNLIAVRRQWYPTLSVASSSYVPGQNFNITNTISAANDGRISTSSTSASNATAVNLGITIGWTFFNSSRGASINAASESLKRQQLLFDVSARNLVLEIQEAYFSLQEQRQLIESYSEILNVIRRQVRITEAQFNDGLVSIADVEQIRTQQYSTLSTLINAYRQLIDASSLLAQTMALPPGTLALPTKKPITLGHWDQPLQSTIEQALRLREEIQASQAAAASASWTATALFNTYWPSFSLGASGGYANSNTTDQSTGRSLDGSTSTQINNHTLKWNGGYGVGFTWQLFDGGINASQAEVQKAAARQALNQAATTRLSVTREVENYYATYLTSLLSLQSSRAQLQAAQVAAAAVQERYLVGVSDISSLVVALNQAIGAANDYASAERTYNSAVARLYRSSARWPVGTKPLLEQRVNTLAKH
jgi:outer membrane protein TolC